MTRERFAKVAEVSRLPGGLSTGRPVTRRVWGASFSTALLGSSRQSRSIISGEFRNPFARKLVLYVECFPRLF
jgi:hypothetical protein